MEPGTGCFVGGCVGIGVGEEVLGGFVGWVNKDDKRHMLGFGKMPHIIVETDEIRPSLT